MCFQKSLGGRSAQRLQSGPQSPSVRAAAPAADRGGGHAGQPCGAGQRLPRPQPCSVTPRAQTGRQASGPQSVTGSYPRPAAEDVNHGSAAHSVTPSHPTTLSKPVSSISESGTERAHLPGSYTVGRQRADPQLGASPRPRDRPAAGEPPKTGSGRATNASEGADARRRPSQRNPRGRQAVLGGRWHPRELGGRVCREGGVRSVPAPSPHKHFSALRLCFHLS